MSKSRELAQVIIPRRRNLIINGGFDVAQRGNNFAAVANAQYTIDRWIWSKSGGVAVHTLSQATNASTLDKYILCQATTGEASPVSSTSHCMLSQYLEGYAAEELGLGTANAKTVTLSFQHAHTVTGTYCVVFRNSAIDRSYVAEYTQSVADTWETAEITVPLDTTGTWLTSNSTGLKVGFTVASGTTYQTTADTWQAGNYIATSNQVNGAAAADDRFRIAKVQLEVGTEATDFEIRHFVDELALCQRYYEKGISTLINPADGNATLRQLGAALGTGNLRVTIPFVVEKRGSPSITYYRGGSGTTSGQWSWFTPPSTWADGSSTTLQRTTTKGFETSFIVSGVTTGSTYLVDGAWAADAEL